MHKYLNDIGISSKDTCIFSTNECEIRNMRRYDEQRKTYGFDERETWCLSYTLISWIYSHVRYMKEEAGKIIDWSAHSFTIPVLQEVYGPFNPNEKYKFHKRIEEEHNVKEIWDIIAAYCEPYLLEENILLSEEKAMCAIEIISIIFPVLWW